MKKIKTIAKAGLITISTLITTLAAKAAILNTDDAFGGNLGANKTFGGQIGLGTKDVRLTIASMINVVIGFLGIVATIIILMGGFIWMTAGGNEEKVGKAKKMLVAGIIGLIIVVAAYAIARFAVGSIVSAT